MNKEGNMTIKRVVTDYFDCINLERFDKLFELFHLEAKLKCPVNFEAKGLEQIKSFYLAVPENYPTHRDEPIDMIIDNERAVVLIEFTGKSKSGVEVNFLAVDWFQFKNDKIYQLNIFYDSLAVKKQLKA